jgi:hypothetical protein
MSIKLRKPLDTAAPEQIDDDYIADVRLPQLLQEREEVNRRLADMFKVTKFDIDWDWKPDAEADEVRTLLTGRAASPAEIRIPVAAQHAQLHRRLIALDRAIELAHRIAKRVADRRLDERLSANRSKIHAAVRKRTLLAIQLQRANQEFLELERELGVEPSVGLPSSGYFLLGPPAPGDEVACVTDALVLVGIVSRKDVFDAQH